jgi:hypothetical protein
VVQNLGNVQEQEVSWYSEASDLKPLPATCLVIFNKTNILPSEGFFFQVPQAPIQKKIKKKRQENVRQSEMAYHSPEITD